MRRAVGMFFLATLILAGCNMSADPTPEAGRSADGTVDLLALTPEEMLGSSIFFDANLSIDGNQACAACHDPAAGWTGPDSDINAGGAVYEGSIAGRFGNRKPPSSAYATSSPILHFEIDKKDVLFVGGNFWDGRATGERLGNPAADQAQGPFLNPLEQALPDNACVVYRVLEPVVPSDYPVAFQDVYGDVADAIAWPANTDTVCATEAAMVALGVEDRALVEQAYDQIALAVAAFEDSSASNAFTSKYDYFLQGVADLTIEERIGLNMFRGKAKCANCHVLDEGKDGAPPLLTDFTFDNVGVPRNPDNPFYDMDLAFNPYGDDWLDEGLGAFLDTRPEYEAYAADNLGKHKVPTLRNVDLRPYEDFVKAYGHNGYFKSLEGIVNFYNTRDVKPVCSDPLTPEAEALAQGCWPEPEIAVNLNSAELGDLHLTDWQEAAIVAFLKTLSDGYQP